MIRSIDNFYLPSLIKRFNKFTLKKKGCWKWNGALTSSGYGSIWVKNKNEPASRISWIIYKGEIPELLLVLHKCDNPACTNPEHLFLGTQKDNTQDMLKKGRYIKPGKLTDKEKSIIITRCFINKEPQYKIAHDYKVTPQAVRYIIKKAETLYGKLYGTDKKTTHKERIIIKEMYNSGITQRSIAKKFNLSPSTIYTIIHKSKINGKTT